MKIEKTIDLAPLLKIFNKISYKRNIELEILSNYKYPNTSKTLDKIIGEDDKDIDYDMLIKYTTLLDVLFLKGLNNLKNELVSIHVGNVTNYKGSLYTSFIVIYK